MASASYIQPHSGAARKGISDDEILAGLFSASHAQMHAHPHDDHHDIIINPIDDHATIPSFPSSGAHTPHFGPIDDEAILSDIPSDSESDLEIPPSPPISQRRHRNATSVSSDDFEFPIFLGRQDEDLESHALPELLLRSEPMPQATSSFQPTGAVDFPVFLGRQDEDVTLCDAKCNFEAPATPMEASSVQPLPLVAAQDYPSTLSGPMMSWWPTLAVKPTCIEEKQFDAESDLLRTWWTTPIYSLDHEWSERFYE